MNILNTAFTCTQVTMNPLSVTYRKLCSVMHQILNRKVEVKHILIMVNFLAWKDQFSINRSIVLLCNYVT